MTVREIVTARKGNSHMSSKNAAKVTIGGKTYTLSGNESEEYLQEVASYLNGKIAQLRSDEDYRNVPFEGTGTGRPET